MKKEIVRTLTEENKRESEALKALWQAYLDKRKADSLPRMTQEEFGELYDIGNQATVGFCLNGTMAISLDAALGFAKGLGCLVGDFSPRLLAYVEALALAAGVHKNQQREAWPFQRVDRERWDECSDEDRGYVQAAVNRALDECEQMQEALNNARVINQNAIRPTPTLTTVANDIAETLQEESKRPSRPTDFRRAINLGSASQQNAPENIPATSKQNKDAKNGRRNSNR